MSELKLGTNVEILGQEYCISGEEERSLKETAQAVNNELRQLQDSAPTYSFGRLALLGCLNIADKFEKLKKEHKSLVNQLFNNVNDAVNKIDALVKVLDSQPEGVATSKSLNI